MQVWVCLPTLFLLKEGSIAEVDDTFAVIFLVGETSIAEASPVSVGGRHAFMRLPCHPPTTRAGGGFHA